jgi:hypothetical protein
VYIIDEIIICELHLCGSGYGTIIGSFECGRESWGSTKGRKFLDKLGGS